ncbi:MAG: hypothetical protein AAGB48_00080 [Planctomycetota bacterium]
MPAALRNKREQEVLRNAVDQLHCCCTGHSASVRLHESMGMQQVGCFKQIGTKFDETLDVGWWQCVLS